MIPSLTELAAVALALAIALLACYVKGRTDGAAAPTAALAALRTSVRAEQENANEVLRKYSAAAAATADANAADTHAARVAARGLPGVCLDAHSVRLSNRALVGPAGGPDGAVPAAVAPN